MANDKREILSRMLEGSKVYLAVEPQRAGVELPEHLMDKPVAILALSWLFPDTAMCLDRDAVRATLRFTGRPFRCTVPWPAIVGARRDADDSEVVWPSEPAENARLVAVAGGVTTTPVVLGERGPEYVVPMDQLGDLTSSPAPRPRPALRLVRDDE